MKILKTKIFAFYLLTAFPAYSSQTEAPSVLRFADCFVEFMGHVEVLQISRDRGGDISFSDIEFASSRVDVMEAAFFEQVFDYDLNALRNEMEKASDRKTHRFSMLYNRSTGLEDSIEKIIELFALRADDCFQEMSLYLDFQ